MRAACASLSGTSRHLEGRFSSNVWFASCTAYIPLTFAQVSAYSRRMSTLRMTSDLRRQLILSAAKRCFARHGFAGTTTKSVAAAASISEGLLFKHFPTKSALYAEILAEECEADPALHRLLELEPSTETLVVLIRGMVRHFLQISGCARSAGSPAAAADDHQPARRRRIRAAILREDRRPDRADVHRFAGARGSGGRCIAGSGASRSICSGSRITPC